MEHEPTFAAPADRPVTIRAAALGLFVGWQLLFLTLSNAMQIVPRLFGEKPVENAVEVNREPASKQIETLKLGVEAVGHVMDGWSEASGQVQSWSMFCPYLPPQSISPLVTLDFADGTTETVGTLFPAAPYRLPLSGFRVHHVESHTVSGLWHFTPEAIAAKPNIYRDGMRHWAETPANSYAGYVRYIAETNQRGRPIERAVLSVRCRPKSTDHTLPATIDRPFIRLTWKDQRIEVWDPMIGEFVPTACGALP